MTITPRTAVVVSSLSLFVIGAAPPGDESPLASRVPCADLATARWGGFAIDEVEEREASRQAPAHCIVRGTVDSEIRFELLLPTPDDWNGRFVMGGGGGFVGTVQNQALTYNGREPSPLHRGFATAGTDTGHRGRSIDASWALERDDREINFGHRAVHVVAQAAKTPRTSRASFSSQACCIAPAAPVPIR